ncbi:Protein N-acetyltransferase, RimJ/RimL family [Prauserella marina]|uniref:Protein N-acetyltransferase, RimJ/RimL family n=1 Tax=Prauserella marina TaxID=530584 RepID=A0A1G6JQJ0_9PSEU|nr:GNAT family protein [Prauserella marina]PWV84506.1 RimJ/RimL family protein N-acetyltransferase [Prauserella marina]SDC20705.1 Protein N-acetyltransferase, RimJ/RimL family [Prauserella marina]
MTMQLPRSARAGRRVPVSPPLRAGRKVWLRDVTPADHRTLACFDREARGEATLAGGYRHWAAHRAGAGDSGDAQFAIETLRGGMLVGSVSSIQADPRSHRFSYGIGIGAPHRRCGYASDAITVLLAVMFWERGYRTCEVSIYGGNIASLSLHGALGFREEGRVRDTELSRDGVRYVVRMAISAPEFAARHPNAISATPGAGERGRHWRPRRGRHWDT